jgi:D-3-phosphoglycerate dehydrogenase
MLKQADYVALCCNLTRDNVHMISTRQFGLMKRGVRIVNTARGPLIDEAALIAALESGVVAGAALDVFEEEPLPASSPLRKFENVIFGTHNGSNTEEAVLRVNEMSIENLFKGLREVRR